MERNSCAHHSAATAALSPRGRAAQAVAPVMRAFCVALLGIGLTAGVSSAPGVATGAGLVLAGASS